VAQATETADHLVGYQQDPMSITDALNLRPVRGGGDDHAAGALHRLADERRHPVGAQLLDLLLEPVRREHAVLVGREAGAVFEVVRLLDVRDIGDRQAALRVHRVHAAERRAGHRAAVVGVAPADDHFAPGCPCRSQ